MPNGFDPLKNGFEMASLGPRGGAESQGSREKMASLCRITGAQRARPGDPRGRRRLLGKPLFL